MHFQNQSKERGNEKVSYSSYIPNKKNIPLDIEIQQILQDLKNKKSNIKLKKKFKKQFRVSNNSLDNSRPDVTLKTKKLFKSSIYKKKNENNNFENDIKIRTLMKKKKLLKNKQNTPQMKIINVNNKIKKRKKYKKKQKKFINKQNQVDTIKNNLKYSLNIISNNHNSNERDKTQKKTRNNLPFKKSTKQRAKYNLNKSKKIEKYDPKLSYSQKVVNRGKSSNIKLNNKSDIKPRLSIVLRRKTKNIYDNDLIVRRKKKYLKVKK
jgi:hypothetical protein